MHMCRWIITNLNSPDYLEACDTVLVVLCVGLQVVDVDVGQAGEQQLKLLLVEDRNQPGKKRKVVKNCDRKIWLDMHIAHLRGMMS